MAIRIVLNGQNRVFDELGSDATVTQLVCALSLKADRVAIEHNGNIVARKNWSEVSLNDSDRIELVHFVGGGRDT